MSQGSFNFKYTRLLSSSGMTSYAGLGIYFDLLNRLNFIDLVNRNVSVSGRDQGWSDWHLLVSLILLNLCGGESVDDIGVLSNDEGLCRLFRRFEKSLKKKERASLKKRFRKGRQSSFPSASSILRYLKRYDQFSEGLLGLSSLNVELIDFMQRNRPFEIATLDMDATLVGSEKSEAHWCYKGFKAYQPLNVYWYEQDMVLHSEFRDGNISAGSDLKRVFEESLSHIPEGVKRVYLRSDSAGYKYELLDYCSEGKNNRFGRIDFCVSSMASKEFKASVSEVSEGDWHPIQMDIGGCKVSSGQEWCEVSYVPSRKGYRVDAPLYRYLAVRESIRQPVLDGFDSEEAYEFPTAVCGGKRYRIGGYVTNMGWDGEELIHWCRKRCGRSEHIHSVMKKDFSGGKLPCGEFGANACWWGVMILALNLHALVKELVLDSSWRRRRMKAVRFYIINIAARVVNRSRQLHIVLSKESTMVEALIRWRKKILQLIPLPSG